MGLGTINKAIARTSEAKGRTLIGGVGATITTESALATLLGINEINVKNFTVINNDINCRITIDYDIPDYCFDNDTEITSYWDYDGKVTRLGSYGFGDNRLGSVGTTNLTHVYLPKCISIGNLCFAKGGLKKKLIYIPRCTLIGTSNLTNQSNFWHGTFNNCSCYFHSAMETINSGGKEGDIAYNLAHIPYKMKKDVYVDSFDKPAAVDDLASTDYYYSSVLTWTAPTTTNTIDYYEIWVDGVLHDTTENLSYTFIGTHNQTYSIKVLVIDEFYNRSEFSNVISVTLDQATQLPLSDIISEYKFEDNVLDTVGSNNGTATDITYTTSGVDKSGVFNGSTSKVIVADSADLSFVDGSGDLPFSISLLWKPTNTNNQWLVSKRNASNFEYQMSYYDGKLQVWLNDSSSNQINAYITLTPINTWYHITMTYNGSGLASGLKIYINGVTSSTTTGTYTGMTNTIAPLVLGVLNIATPILFLNGLEDCVRIWDTELSQAVIKLLSTLELAGTDINP